MNANQLISTTDSVDPVFKLIFLICLVLLIGITLCMLYFVVRYHRSRAPEATSQADGNLILEIIWIVLPTILVLAMFYYGWSGYLSLRTVPKDAMNVTATARMWSWNFKYENGKSSSKLYVQAGKPVRIELESLDVIHGFFLPAFRVKRDVVPGMKNHVWFVADRPGSYDIFCSQYCGTNHSSMITTVEALPEAQFAAWISSSSPSTKKLHGKQIAEDKGCIGCHTLDGSPSVGPSFKGIWGQKVKVLHKGSPQTLIVDEKYISLSITEPAEDVVDGFQPIMPAFNDLKKEELDALVEFIKGLQ